MSPVLTIPEVAKLAGWSRERMFRHLVRMNEELGGMLLCNTSRGKDRPRWTITLKALQAIAPQWFHDPESLQQQIDQMRREENELRSRVVKLEKIQSLQTEWLSDLAARQSA